MSDCPEVSPDPLAYSVPNAAKAAGLSERKVWSEIAAGQLKARKVGSRTLVLRSDLLAYLDALPEAELADAR